ncbi:MAG: hypothetical protein EXQ81_09220 [Thermoleophilia bacterium]|nr:hypothetical protein [Thermoleophilia bacterium]
MKAARERVGPYRVAAILIGCALALEIVRVRVLAGNGVATVGCTFGEVVFLALAATAFMSARRRQGRDR